ncbi:MAG: AAA family ATPase [Pseudomonadales bacterium]|nr:AAA family ATPase [Pseudomonadales bacterium]
MIKSTFGITKEPFNRSEPELLSQQKEILKLIKIHSQHGGFSVIIGNAGVGKSVLREHIEKLDKERDTVVASFSQTMHSYINILKQLAESFKIDVPVKSLEKELIHTAYRHIKDRKVLYTLIDEAHLMDITVLRKLRLLFDRFPKKHNLVLFGQRDLLYYLSMNVNEDIKSRITYSENIFPLNDENLEQYMMRELDAVGLGHHTYDTASIELILRSTQGNLRLCKNLSYSSLVDACREGKRTVSTTHVNNVLVQPHWRTHDELIKQQVRL